MSASAIVRPLRPVADATDRTGRIVLGLGEWHVSADPASTLVCLGLGSCVALCAYDPIAKVAGMAHMVLPDSSMARNGAGGPRFVDVAVPLVLDTMAESGALRTRIRVQLVGGAHVLQATTAGPQIGDRNVEAAIRALTRRNLHAKYEHTGGTHGRTVKLAVDGGNVEVATAGKGANSA